MQNTSKKVDGFRFMPPSLGAWFAKDIPDAPFSGEIPWTPLKKPVAQTVFSLVTTAGISMKTDAPFDMEREKREPEWGDPSHREIRSTATEKDIDIHHLHINTDYVRQDLNVMLPLARFRELEIEGIIGGLAPTAYSYYGFQLNPEILLEKTLPRIITRMRQEAVEAVLLTPA